MKELFSKEWPDLRGYVGSLLAASSGLRLGELQALTLEDLHLDSNYIHVRRSWDKRLQAFTGTTKTGRARNIFIPENVKNEIIRLIEGTIEPISCKNDNSASFCNDIETCAFREIWVKVTDAISNIVDHVTFADMMKRSKELQIQNSAYMYQI